MNGSMEKNVSRDTPLKAPRLNLVIVRSEVAYVYGCMNLGFWDSHSASFWVGWLSVCVCVCFFVLFVGRVGGGGGEEEKCFPGTQLHFYPWHWQQHKVCKILKFLYDWQIRYCQESYPIHGQVLLSVTLT